MISKRLLNILPFLLLSLWYAFFLFHHTDLTQGDLGRHLKNGEIIVSALTNHDFPTLSKILHTNFYAYTEPTFPFINHHWGSGVIFYLLFTLGGFPLLSIWFALLSLATFYFFFTLGQKHAGTWLTGLTAIFLIPLIAERVQIRPEIFSYFFMGLYLFILSRYRAGELKPRYLLILLFTQLLWANLHIYSFFGFIILGLFFTEEFLSARRAASLRHLASLFGGFILVGLINPSGLTGLLYPLRIFDNYAFQIQENQSALTFARVFPWYPNAIIFKIAATIFIVTLITALIKKPTLIKNALVIFAAGTVLMGWLAVRNWTLFALAALAAWPLLINEIKPVKNVTNKYLWWSLLGIIIAITLIINRSRLPVTARELGLSATPHSLDAATFVTTHHLAAPLFNDFNIGGYATWAAFPVLPPFTDNRPEAYSKSFFTDTYIPAQHDEAAWKTTDERYNFNVIWYSFSNSDSLPFILERIQDPAWAPVFADTYSIIFLKRNPQNEMLIKQYEIPKDKFSLESVE